MTDNELKEWFWKMFNSCYCVTHSDYPESLFKCYDKDFIRKYKFKVLQGKEIIYPEKPNGVCLFEIDYKNRWLNCTYNEIWLYLSSNSTYGMLKFKI